VCEQFVHDRYMMMEGSGVERATSGSLVRRPTITPLRHATVQLQEYNVQR